MLGFQLCHTNEEFEWSKHVRMYTHTHTHTRKHTHTNTHTISNRKNQFCKISLKWLDVRMNHGLLRKSGEAKLICERIAMLSVRHFLNYSDEG